MLRKFVAWVQPLDRELWVMLALGAFAWIPLLAPGYFLNAHDAPHTLFFLRQFDQSIRDGFLIPRWGADFALGYGYPLFLFYSPLAYYVAEAFHLLGANITLAIKLTFVVAFIFSSVSMYALGRRFFGRSAGLLAGLLYTYTPYRLVDVYVRSDLTEAFAFIFLPILFLTFLNVIERGTGRTLAGAGLAYAGLILAHNGTALIFTPLLVAYVLYLLWREWRHSGLAAAGRGAARAMSAALLGAGLSAFFLLPAFFERQFIVEEQWIRGSFNYLKHFVYPSQFLSPFWGFGYAGEGLTDYMSFQLGLIPLTLALAAVALRWKLTQKRGDRNFLIAATLAIIFFMLPASAPIWKLIPLAALVQFPWRLLILTTLTLALLGSSLAAEGSDKSKPATFAATYLLALVVVVGSFAYTHPEYTERSIRSEEPVAVIEFELVYPPDRTGMMAWTQEQPMMTPLVPQYLAGEPLIKAHVLEGDATVQTLRHGGSSVDVLVQAKTPATIEFYTYYFPGWRAKVDGELTPIRPSGAFGLIALDAPAGEHQVSLRFGDTPIRAAGKLVSLLCLIVAGWLLSPKGKQTFRA